MKMSQSAHGPGGHGMHMPGGHGPGGLVSHGHGGHGHRHRRHMKPKPGFLIFLLVENLFWAGVATCMLLALHRIGDGLKTTARLKALTNMPDAFTDEERLRLVQKVKTVALGPF
jgi:hypothetical protein